MEYDCIENIISKYIWIILINFRYLFYKINYHTKYKKDE